MIKLQAIGHLGKDAVVNNVNGKSVINFTVAHTEKYKDAQGVQKDKTVWVDCAYWTDRTAIAPYLKKGTQVFVDGAPDVRSYTTQDGRTGATLILRVASVQLLGAKSDDGGGSNYQSTNATTQPQQSSYSTPSSNYQPVQPQNEMVEPLDDLPF
ncbi:MAG: single-stranded DNA-binding protein [Chitinophagaceae bacterium]